MGVDQTTKPIGRKETTRFMWGFVGVDTRLQHNFGCSPSHHLLQSLQQRRLPPWALGTPWGGGLGGSGGICGLLQKRKEPGGVKSLVPVSKVPCW